MAKKQEINWEKEIEDCISAFDLLKLEKEFLDSEENPNLDNFYVDIWYKRLDDVLDREDKFGDIEDLKERLGKLETKFKRHDHKDNGVVIKEL